MANKLVKKEVVAKAERVVSNLPIPKITSSVWWNIAIIVGGLILLVVAFKEALVALGLREDSKSRKERERLENDTLKVLASTTGETPNYPDFQYEQWANKAYQGMRNSNIADDDDLVVEAATFMMNNADVVKWSAAYGSRQLYQLGINDGDRATLFEAIASDVRSKNRQIINDNWASKNIKFRV